MAVSKSLRYQILRRDNHTCRYCGRTAPEVRLTVDHVVPEALGGPDTPENLVAACSDCNSGKSATPPDAALVAQVQDDALRWSAAVRAVAADMAAEVEHRDVARAQFQQGWQRWKIREHSLPLPSNWRDTVDTFAAVGLPMAVLLECVGIAMGRDKVETDDKFRYMCGVAWKRVSELQQAALQRVARPGLREAVRQGNGDEVISDLFGALPWCDGPAAWGPFLAEFDEAHEDEELGDGSPRSFDHWSDFEKTFAQMVQRLADSYFELTNRNRQVLKKITPEAAARYREESLRQHTQADMEDAAPESIDAYAVLLAIQDHPEVGGL